MAAEEPDLILLHIEMPRLDGIAVCERLKTHPARRLIPVVILTASRDYETRTMSNSHAIRDAGVPVVAVSYGANDPAAAVAPARDLADEGHVPAGLVSLIKGMSLG